MQTSISLLLLIVIISVGWLLFQTFFFWYFEALRRIFKRSVHNFFKPLREIMIRERKKERRKRGGKRREEGNRRFWDMFPFRFHNLLGTEQPNKSSLRVAERGWAGGSSTVHPCACVCSRHTIPQTLPHSRGSLAWGSFCVFGLKMSALS